MCGTKFRDAVALLAAVLVWRCGKLALVNVLMTTTALRLRNSKYGALSPRKMAFVAFHFDMAALERVSGRGMFFNPECGGLKPVDDMTGGTISASWPRQKLTFVIIRMANGAGCVRHRRLEVALRVAFAACNAAVFPEKRKSGLGMIEAFELRNLCPFRCVVARLAGPFEASFMRICVADSASLEGESRVSDIRLGVGHRAVAFGTGYNGVCSREREFCRCVLEVRSRLPRICSVTLGAVRTQLPSMLILMAARAGTAESQVSVIQILNLNSCTRGRINRSRVMALLAS